MSIPEIFNAALDIPDAIARARFLDEACAGQPDVRARVEALLIAHFQNPTPPTGVYEPAITYDVGTIINGKYKIREKIGEGGMGTVFVVETITDVKTLFALKLIKPGFDSKSVLARFDQERQALALMNHPNIAKFIDAGSIPTGQPYFVMELIKGMPITNYCDKERLTIEERLKLFVAVCQGVQHAHHKGIIHRDLKPGNILVALFDGMPVPKVIDFGVAKATLQPLTSQTIYSEINSIIGTLEYMAPEQAEVKSLDIDTRADLYALGVILYELLTGTLPFSRKELGAAAMFNMLKLIREAEPEKPSTKLSQSGTLTDAAASRHVNPNQLMKMLKGEIDWIVMKCLEKQRARRYDSPNQLAEDINNYLEDRPLIARPPSAGYRLQKFYRRHQGAVLAAVAVLFLLVAGIIGTSWGLVKAIKAEAEAHQSAETAKAINQFLEYELLRQADPSVQAEAGLAVEKDIKVREAVERAGKLLLGNKLDDQPLVKAALHHTIGRTFLTIGEFNLALVHLERAELLRRKLLGEGDRLHLESQLDIVKAKLALSRNTEAETLVGETLALMKQKLPMTDPLHMTGKRLLALAYQQLNKFEENRAKWQEILADAHKYHADKPLESIRSEAGLAVATGLVAIKHQNDAAVRAEADRLFDQSLAALKRTLGAQHPDTLDHMNSLAVYSSRKGDLPKAEGLYNEMIQSGTSVYDSDHNSVLITRINLATLYSKQNRLDETLRLLEAVHKTYLKRYNADYDGAISAYHNIGGVLMSRGKPAEAEPYFRDSLRRLEAKKGLIDHVVLQYCNSLGECLFRQNKFAEAEPLFQRMYQGNLKVTQPSEQNLYVNRINLVKT